MTDTTYNPAELDRHSTLTAHITVESAELLASMAEVLGVGMHRLTDDIVEFAIDSLSDQMMAQIVAPAGDNENTWEEIQLPFGD